MVGGRPHRTCPCHRPPPRSGDILPISLRELRVAPDGQPRPWWFCGDDPSSPQGGHASAKGVDRPPEHRQHRRPDQPIHLPTPTAGPPPSRTWPTSRPTSSKPAATSSSSDRMTPLSAWAASGPVLTQGRDAPGAGAPGQATTWHRRPWRSSWRNAPRTWASSGCT